MPNDPAHILIYGSNSKLLDLRKLVLEGRGYMVQTTCSQMEARQFLDFMNIDLLMLCHTLPTEECDSLATEAETAWPRTKVLLLTAPTLQGCHQLQNHDSFAMSDGPTKLVQRVDDLLSPSGYAHHRGAF